MVRIRTIRNAIVKGLYDHTGLTAIPVESVTEKEAYPYITYNFTSPYIPFEGMGNVSTEFVPSTDERFEYDVVEKVQLQPKATLSLNVYSNSRKENNYDGKMEALELAHEVMAWFEHSGWQYLSDNNITVVGVEAFGDRGTIIVDSNEHRIGMDVIIRFSDELVRRYETIEEYTINKQIK